MKRRDFLRHLDDAGCEFRREGGNHTMYWNPANREVAAVPRHREISERLTIRICKELGIDPLARS